ncbi:MAG TPA: DUF58 domain-containing protein [Candidatus Pullichristensenella excrementigallinarum]|uniref:DUF58 domain-containing protein n=1 Tax=Candidatus Pullichristensenella excrementigallinarum TaxID=2840907 RepID=A0A9D1IBF5_9FIRM|nr:DUF58 domain-containing protein [Candidatus Pullichristensenella excrementigallinarum]
MTARFWSLLGVLAALLAVGLSTGGQVYYFLFFAFVMVLLLSVASVLWTLFTVRVEMKGLRPRVERGDRLMTIFTVRHTSLLPVSAIRIVLCAPSAYSGTQEISVATPPYRKKTFRYLIACPHRGSYEVGIARFRCQDLFGLFSISRKSGQRLLRVDVAPKVHAVETLELKTQDMGPELRSRASEDTASPSDIRKWQEGDVLKKVHWKLTMRKRELMVRTYEESSRPDTLIVPDLSEIAALSDQALSIEDAICEEALSHAKAQLEAGYPVRMPLLAAHPAEIAGQFPQDLPMFLDALMRVKFDSPYAYEQVQMQMLRRITRTGGCVLVSCKFTTRIADMALKLARSGVKVKLIWITDSAREDALEMVERLKMENILVSLRNPWSDE